jgi:uncharacterized protein YdeI (YjbR/CyaY-like superfamily)
VVFVSPEKWRAWLEKHHATTREVWLLHYKKKAAKRSLAYDDAGKEALCFGWIDGLLRSIDGAAYALRYSPRAPQSVWSESNKRRAESLIRAGRMTGAGLERIAEAKANGEWDAATAREDTQTIPSDLAQALKKNKGWATFEKWPVSRKKQYLSWLKDAKRPETRQKRVWAIVEMAMAGNNKKASQ